jgi:hypothetical protein
MYYKVACQPFRISLSGGAGLKWSSHCDGHFRHLRSIRWLLVALLDLAGCRSASTLHSGPQNGVDVLQLAWTWRSPHAAQVILRRNPGVEPVCFASRPDACQLTLPLLCAAEGVRGRGAAAQD